MQKHVIACTGDVIIQTEEPGRHAEGLYTSTLVDGAVHYVMVDEANQYAAPGILGFTRWVYDNKEALARTLGVGEHFVSWFGDGLVVTSEAQEYVLLSARDLRADAPELGVCVDGCCTEVQAA